MDKIICIGKNYLDHAKELGDAVPEMPVLFLKPESSLVMVDKNGQTVDVPYPKDLGSLHHECEVVVKLNGGGSNLTSQHASTLIESVTIGLDMTLRDLQTTLKKNGHPWEVSKVFAGAAVVGPFVPVHEFQDFESTEFFLEIDGELRQKGLATQMRLSVSECIAYASKYFPLKAGDLVFTGTPAGVGPVNLGGTARLKFGTKIEYCARWI
jgi:2-keto-4-pentenoate hydratase/2-oxohepta-3-ene-1,7-dioic acid hydratase in catechol pathway